MRTTQALTVLAGVLVATGVAGGVARADVAGTYDVKYEEISSNCTNGKLAYAPGTLEVKVKGTQLLVDIDRTPPMVGVPPKSGSGNVSAKSKPGKTMIQGMQGAFSVAGRITSEGALYLVMTGEYSANGRPLCTQTWNISGAKQGSGTPPPPATTPPPKSK